ncbi:hypothetical protein [Paenibacillus pini]|uniref:Uncharacterized protein n=1 Tax=Paenibacillus pini JCM 16418 TaxID=1236976 RepID=W7Y7W2_9BACL|nr:hypothetical protein [Paenibacillus pini]GAF07010.1 hypothetical protein JCM16418_997 [Paenibacillus pini JCM 16418]
MSEEFRRLEAYFSRRTDADIAEQLLRNLPLESVRIEKFGGNSNTSSSSENSYGMRSLGFASLYSLGSPPTAFAGVLGGEDVSRDMLLRQGIVSGQPDEHVLLSVAIPQSWAQRAAQVIEQQGGRLR